MSCIPPKDVNPQGLHQRYCVTKTDGQPCDPMATYFVLRLDQFGNDGQHIAACRTAALGYADYIDAHAADAPHLLRVARELRTLIENLEAAEGGDS